MPPLYRMLDALPPDYGPSVVAIGNFDGVHLGHRRILDVTVRHAAENGWRSAALTFDPHPARVLAPDRAPPVMSTLEQRAEIFAELGVDDVVVMGFDRKVAALSPAEFVSQALVERLAVRRVIVGENFRFGRNGAGDIATLDELGRKLGFRVEAVAPVEVSGRIVSSSRIRMAVSEGRISDAQGLLGRWFALRGQVVPGHGIGSKQTVPTLNLQPDSELLPADGVYITRTLDRGGTRRWRSVTNVGVRPTFGGDNRTVETHLLDELEGFTPERIEVQFLRRIREEKRFESSVELRQQILEDLAEAERYFAETARPRS
jgi:riboflavin kinase/FMN adenylyltransferase